MIIDALTFDEKIVLGKQGENLSREVIFDCKAWLELHGLTGGTLSLVAQRPTDEDGYPVPVETTEDTVTWTVNSTDVAIDGIGWAELRYTVGEQILKSKTFLTLIGKGLTPKDEPPEAYVPYINQVIESASGVENMTATAEVENDGGNPEVEVTKTVGEVINLDFLFKNVIGRKGDDGKDGKDGKDGADGVTPSFSIGTVVSGSPASATITGTDANPVLNLVLPKGDRGWSVDLRNVNIYTDSGATRGVVTEVSAVVGKVTYDIDLYNIKGASGKDGDGFNDVHLYTDSGLPRVVLTPYEQYYDGHTIWDIDFYNIGLPDATSADEGKLLGVNSSGKWGKTDAFEEEAWTFTLADNTTVTKTILVKVVV